MGSTQRLPAQGPGRSCLLSQVFLVLGLHLPASDGKWYSFLVFCADPQTHMLQFLDAQVCREHV